MIGVLKMVKKCKTYQNKGSQASPTPWDLTKKLSQGDGIWQTFENLPGGCSGVDDNAWNCSQYISETCNKSINNSFTLKMSFC